MNLSIVFGAIAAGSLGYNVYQALNRRGLKAMLEKAGVANVEQTAILKAAIDALNKDGDALKAKLNALIDEVGEATLSKEDLLARLKAIYTGKTAPEPTPAPAEPTPADPAAGVAK